LRTQEVHQGDRRGVGVGLSPPAQANGPKDPGPGQTHEVVVAVFLRAAMAALYGPGLPRGLGLVPWIGMALDYAENVACGILVARYPAEPAGVALVAGLLTAAKNAAYATGIVTVLAGLVRTAKRRPRARIG
jgi:hypothetical protein